MVYFNSNFTIVQRENYYFSECISEWMFVSKFLGISKQFKSFCWVVLCKPKVYNQFLNFLSIRLVTTSANDNSEIIIYGESMVIRFQVWCGEAVSMSNLRFEGWWSET